MITRLQILGLTILAALLVLVGAYALGSQRARRAVELVKELEETKRAVAGARGMYEARIETDRLPVGGAARQLQLDWLRDEPPGSS